jgi:ABC-2 type transport system ATP-binding protein
LPIGMPNTILLDGRLLTTDAMRVAGHAQQFRVRLSGPQPNILEALRQISGVVDAAPTDAAENYLVEIAPERLTAADFARAIVRQGLALSELVEVKPDLERVFLDLTRQAAANAA